MKTTLNITALIISLCFAGNCSDNPEETATVPTHTNVTDLDSNTDTTGIFEQINEEVREAGGEGTDQDISDAAGRVFILRGITDSATINNVLAEYYL